VSPDNHWGYSSDYHSLTLEEEVCPRPIKEESKWPVIQLNVSALKPNVKTTVNAVLVLFTTVMD
jgi:hypothetical protein